MCMVVMERELGIRRVEGREEGGWGLKGKRVEGEGVKWVQ